MRKLKKKRQHCANQSRTLLSVNETALASKWNRKNLNKLSNSRDLEKAKEVADNAVSERRQIERKAADDALQALMEDKTIAVKSEGDKVRKELNEKLKIERDKYFNSAMRANKSVYIRKDNEDAFAELLNKSFGSDSNYRIVYSAQKPQSLVTSSSIE